jgi:cytochrome c oxidase subunit 2
MSVSTALQGGFPAELRISAEMQRLPRKRGPFGSRRSQPADQQYAASEYDRQQRGQVEARLSKHCKVTPQAHCIPWLAVQSDQRRSRILVAAVLCWTTILSGCSGIQSALDTHGSQAQALARLFWLFTAVLALVWLATMVALLLATLRGRRRRDDGLLQSGPPPGRPMWTTFSISLAAGTVILVGLSVLSLGGQAHIYARDSAPAVRIRIIGHQWWWQVRYDEGDSARAFDTANEIRIPVGVPVEVKLATADVIHSFWIPSLAGKLDLIPGRENVLNIEADKPGLYRGQCAEFCGRQHATMAMFVIALLPDEFEKWRAGQTGAANPTSGAPDEATRIGTAAFR